MTMFSWQIKYDSRQNYCLIGQKFRTYWHSVELGTGTFLAGGFLEMWYVKGRIVSSPQNIYGGLFWWVGDLWPLGNRHVFICHRWQQLRYLTVKPNMILKSKQNRNRTKVFHFSCHSNEKRTFNLANEKWQRDSGVAQGGALLKTKEILP